MNKLNEILNKILRPLKLLYYNVNCSMRVYSIDKKLNILIIYLENVKISSIVSSTYYYDITFEDGSILNFWNENRWHVWMSTGTMTFSNGRIMKWDAKMPSYEVLYKYKKMILKYEQSKKVKKVELIEDFYDCLPIKLIRKEKLKRIKK